MLELFNAQHIRSAPTISDSENQSDVDRSKSQDASNAFAENLAPNPSFENGETSPLEWSYYDYHDGTLHLWNNISSHTGSYSVGIANVSQPYTVYMWSTSKTVPVDSTKSYIFSIWYKWIGTPAPQQNAEISVSEYNENGTHIGGFGLVLTHYDDGDWHHRLSSCPSFNSSTVSVTLQLEHIYRQTASKAYVRYDDVFFGQARVHNLNTGLNYTTIQEAINAPETSDGHTIFVEEGKYYEHIIVNKSLSLVGENISTTVIDGNFSGNPVTIAASHVNMTSFTVQKAWLGIWYVFNGFGIYVAAETSYNNISHNIIANNPMYGIMLNASSHNIISDNIIRNNTGPGVTVWSSSKNMIFNNTIENRGLIIGGSGIYAFNSTENTVYDNIVSDNGLGIALVCSGHNQLHNNNMTDNRYNFWMTGLSKSDFNNSIDMSNLVDGRHIYCLQSAKNVVVDSQLNIATLYIIDSENITLKDLLLTKNGIGLLLWETNDSRIENVTASNNIKGVDLTLCANITVCRCSIRNNDNGGIYTNCSLMCNIFGNEIRANGNFGIWMDYSSNVSIDGNNITGPAAME